LYDRKLVEYLRTQGDSVGLFSVLAKLRSTRQIISAEASPVLHASGAVSATKQSPAQEKYDILIQDELNHPSLILANRGKHPYPVISLVHHLRCSEPRPDWQNIFYRVIEKQYLQSVDGFIFNSRTTERVVKNLVENRKPGLVAYPPADRFGNLFQKKKFSVVSNPSIADLFLGT
jgi:hypothetical protein